MEKYKISIIIPAYNAEKYIKRCVESILLQRYQNWEAIIINDGSTDNTDAICREFQDDERIHYISKDNEGVSIARNCGIKEASGDIITFVDSDDWLENNMLQTIADNWNDETDLLMFDYYERFDGRKRELNFFEKNKITFDEDNEKYTVKYLLLSILQYYHDGTSGAIREIGVPWAKAFSLKKIRQNNILFPVELTLYEDCIFLMSAVEYFKTIEYIKIPLYNYFVNSTSICNTIYQDREKCLYNFEKREEYVCDFIGKKYINDYEMKCALNHIRFNMMCDTLWWIAEENNKNIIKQGYLYCYNIANKISASQSKMQFKQKVYVYLCRKKFFFLLIIFYKILHKIQKGFYK